MHLKISIVTLVFVFTFFGGDLVEGSKYKYKKSHGSPSTHDVTFKHLPRTLNPAAIQMTSKELKLFTGYLFSFFRFKCHSVPDKNIAGLQKFILKQISFSTDFSHMDPQGSSRRGEENSRFKDLLRSISQCSATKEQGYHRTSKRQTSLNDRSHHKRETTGKEKDTTTSPLRILTDQPSKGQLLFFKVMDIVCDLFCHTCSNLVDRNKSDFMVGTQQLLNFLLKDERGVELVTKKYLTRQFMQSIENCASSLKGSN